MSPPASTSRSHMAISTRGLHATRTRHGESCIWGPLDMENEDDHHAELKRQLAEVAHVLNPAERELWSAMQRFVDEHAIAGGSRIAAPGSGPGPPTFRPRQDVAFQT